jgi:putative cardiolipin synthase
MEHYARAHVMPAWLLALSALLLCACATAPPGASFPKTDSTALARPQQTVLGRNVEARAREHPGLSGIRLFASGSDAFTLRVQMADRAQRTLDVQYFIFKDDDSGKLLMGAMLRAAKRGVRVRVLMDDTQAREKDDRVSQLAANPNIEVRLYNPFYYRGSLSLIRYAELALTFSRLDYRMHNKLFVADNATAIVGGRNVGDEYFDAGDSLQFGDYDAFVMGPVVRDLSKSFDEYWNSTLAIPVRALAGSEPEHAKLAVVEQELKEHRVDMRRSDEERAIRSGNPLASILGKGQGIVWAKAEVIADSPDKASVEGGEAIGTLLRRRLLEAAAETKRELLIVSPYCVPGKSVMGLLRELRERGVTIRVLTNSLLSTDVPAAHSAYRTFRVPLLKEGVELYEVKPLPGKPSPRGGLLKSPSSGEFSLHAKAYVFDRRRVFIGSANLDPRSLHLNTEIGLMIDSPEIAQQVVKRFDTITSPANSFVLALQDDGKGNPRIVWNSVKDGKAIAYTSEPGSDTQRALVVDLLGILPLEGEL